MKCTSNEKILSRYVDNDLPSEMFSTVQTHMDACSRCRDAEGAFRRINAALGSIPKITAPAGFDEELFARLDEIDASSGAAGVVETVGERVREFIGAVLPAGATVRVKAAVAGVFMMSAFFVGIYFTQQGTPCVVNVKGAAFIQKSGAGEWNELDKGFVIKKGDVIKTSVFSEVDFSLVSKYSIRLKAGTEVKINGLTPKYRSGFSEIELLKGKVLVDIEKGFTGSTLEIITQGAAVRALGTKFAVSNEGADEKTWVGVLEGKVKVLSGEGAKKDRSISSSGEVLVGAGMKTEFVPGGMPSKPLPLLEKEWRRLSELYMIGKRTRVALLISGGEERVLELLGPCPIFISDEKPRAIPKLLEEAGRLIDLAIKEDDEAMHLRGIEKLQSIVDADLSAEYNLQLLLFIGAYNRYVARYEQAIKAFEKTLELFPGGYFASIADCAIAVVMEEDLHDVKGAMARYRHIETKYSDSPEARFAAARRQKYEG